MSLQQHSDLLFELGTEELPPTTLKQLQQALAQHFIAGLDAAGLAHGPCHSYATPRRLALWIEAVAEQQPDRAVEKRGPAVAAAFGADGKPTKAAEGFAQSCGTSVAALERLSTDKGEWLVFRAEERGKPASELLPHIAAQALNQLPIAKRMRWGSSQAEFVRPPHWLLFLHGDAVVPCALLETQADRLTYGHRFHHPTAIRIDKAADYQTQLRDAKVIADFAERRAAIVQQVQETAQTLGGHAEFDDDLLDEVTALVEWPVAISGGFEQRFLAVPHEALILTMKKNQKYFHLLDNTGKLLPHFITIANIESQHPALIRAGNERVVRPRLADAMFFWEQDGKTPLAKRQDALAQVIFQQQLGSMAEKSARVAQLAKQIAPAIGGDAHKAERAGLLSRCDLVSETVFEFPEMQGVMGRYLATRDGEDGEVATAMEEFYLPRFAGDKLPATPTGIAIALAERVDTLVGIFAIGQKPTGDKDPFGLRRAAIGILRILREQQLALPLQTLLEHAATLLSATVPAAASPELLESVHGYLLDRLRGIYADEGVATDLFQAVAAVNPATLSDFDTRIAAVIAFRQLPEAAALAAANKRIRNLLKKSAGALPTRVEPALFAEAAEHELFAQLQASQSKILPLLARRDYQDVLVGLAALREPTDRYFDDVMVMTEDERLRNNRLALLAELSNLFLEVADISALQD